MDAQSAASSPIRAEIRDEALRLNSTKIARQRQFDDKAEIVNTDDGTLKSKKSLTWQTAKQAGHDASATLESAKGVVRDLLEKKKQ